MKKKIILVSIAITCLSGVFVFLSCHKKADYEEELSERISIMNYGSKSKLVNTETGKTLIDDLSVDWIREGRDSLAVFAKDDKRGYFNVNTGEIIVPLTYKHAWVFSEGYAGVVQNDMVGFINTKGELVIPCRYPYRGNALTEFVFEHGRCVVADSLQHIGAIDTLGNWVIEPKYDAVHLSKDYAIVYNKGQFKKQIDFEGHVLSDGLIDYVNRLYYSKSYMSTETGGPDDGRALNEKYMEYRVEGRSGLMTREGRYVTPPIYTDIEALTEDLFIAQLQDWESKVIINGKGEIVTK
jgi:hypothetical protein